MIQADGPETYEIRLTEENTFTVVIADNQPQESALTGKTGQYQDGTFTWTICYEPGKKEANLPLTLVDEFDSTYHEYKEGSFRVIKEDDSEIPVDPSDVTVEKGNGKTTLAYRITEEISEGTDPVAIIYNTVLTDQGLTSTSNRKVTNAAWLRNSRNEKIGENAAGSAEFQKVDWLQKTSDGTLHETENGEKYVTWKVTVKTNGKQLSKLILHDQLQNGTEYAKLDVDAISITAYRNGQTRDETNGYGHTIKQKENKNGFDLTFAVTDPADQYIVTYNTVIEEAYFHGDHSGAFNNQAALDYGWELADGSTFEPESPTVTEPVNVDGRMLTKAGAGYDPGTHEITWRVVVNPRKLDLEKVVIKDDVKEYGQTYVKESFSMEESDVTGTVTESAEGDSIKIEFGDIGTKTFAYTFKTTVDNAEDYAYNLSKKTYENIAGVTAQLKKSDGTAEPLTASARGIQDIRSNVLQKKAEGYNYEDHTIGWCITVNENRMPMKPDGGILVEDTLAEGLTYVEGSLEVTKEAADEGGAVESEQDNRITLDTSTEGGNQKLTFKCDQNTELEDKMCIRFRTKVDVDKVAGFKSATEFKISNTAVLKRNGYNECSVNADQSMDNQILAKSGKYDKAQGAIAYTVNVNPHGITLDNTTVRDDLPEGLQIDKDTIKLYEAAVSSDGTFTKRGSVDLTQSLTVNMLDGWFTINLPNGNTPYVLEYSTDVTDVTKTSFNNKISLNGTVSGGAGQGGTDVGLGSGGGGGGGTSSPKVNLTLTKVDALRPNVKLEGAEFRISDEDGPMSKVTTGEDGKVVFRYLKRGKTYIIEETKAPKGYQKMEKPIQIKINNDIGETPKEYAYEPIPNDPVTGSLSFAVKNDKGGIPAGAEFTLTDRIQGSEWKEKTVVSDTDGKVIFTDIPYGTYTLREVKTPEQHIPNTTEYQVVVDENGKATLTNPSDTEKPDTPLTEIINIVKETSITIKKIDRDTREALADVQFSVFDSEKNLLETKNTDAAGIVKFENLGAGCSYLIKETIPKGYSAETETQKVTSMEDGLELTWENYRVGLIMLTLRNSMDKTPLSGVRMGLWFMKRGSTWEDVKDTEPYKIVQSDENGSLSFGELPKGDYRICMLEAPEGYETDSCLMVLNVDFDAEGTPVITIKNSETGEALKDGIVDIALKKAETGEPGADEPDKPGSGDPDEPDLVHPDEPGKSDSGQPGKSDKPDKSNSGHSGESSSGSHTSAEEARTPNTGDSSPWVWFLAIALLSGGTIIAGVLRRIFRKG